ncbi:MAG: metallopeptidase family protein [Limisphaerales bacterium]
MPIIFKHKPGESLQAEGIEQDALGVFTGAELSNQGHAPVSPKIILFLENVRDVAEGDGNSFRGEIRMAFLHELGHFLRLDEDDLTEAGLE